MNYQHYRNAMLLTSSDTKRKLMHIFLFTYSAQRTLVSIYIRRVYATAINFPCITSLHLTLVTLCIIGSSLCCHLLYLIIYVGGCFSLNLVQVWFRNYSLKVQNFRKGSTRIEIYNI